MNMESVPETVEIAAWVKAATIVLAATAFFLFAGGAVFRKKLTGWLSVAYSGLLFCVLLAGPVAMAYWADGSELISKGARSPWLQSNMDEMDDFFESELHLKAKDSHYFIFLLGDSTHMYSLRPHQRLLPQLWKRLPEDPASDIEMYTLAIAGFDAFDYYFVTNRLMKEEIDLIILPINLRSFGAAWSERQVRVYPELQGHVRLREIAAATALNTAQHPTRWEHILLRKLDIALFGGDAEPFVRGIRQRYRSDQDALTSRLESMVARYADPIPYERIRPKPSLAHMRAGTYPYRVESDHEMINAFRALNDLAARHNTDVLYYTVQPKKLGILLLRCFDVIRESLTESPNVHFVTLPFTLEKEHFARGEHVTPQGMQITAGHLADALADILPALIEEKLGVDGQE